MTRIQLIRQRWEQWFGKPWPHSDVFLRELLGEAKEAHGIGATSKRFGKDVDETCLELMTDNMD